MSGRHRKPTRTGLRLAKAGTLTMMVVAPMGATGSAFALPWSPADLDDDDSSSASDDDSSEWANRHADDDDDDRRVDWADQDTSRWHDQSAAASGRTSADRARKSAAEAKRAAAEVRRSQDRTDATPASSTRRVEATPASSTRRTQATPSRRSAASAERAATRSAAESAAQSAASEAKWDRLAQCESGQNWNANTGNGYKGGVQFSDATWRAYGGHEYARSADQASRDEQIAVARKVQREQGWNAWPACSRKLGYRS